MRTLFLLLFCSFQIEAMDLVADNQQSTALVSQMRNIMHCLHQITGTKPLETDYTIRSLILQKLQQDPTVVNTFIVNQEPTPELLALFFDHRQRAIIEMPSQLTKDLAFNKWSSATCAVASTFVTLLVALWTVRVCY